MGNKMGLQEGAVYFVEAERGNVFLRVTLINRSKANVNMLEPNGHMTQQEYTLYTEKRKQQRRKSEMREASGSVTAVREGVQENWACYSTQEVEGGWDAWNEIERKQRPSPDRNKMLWQKLSEIYGAGNTGKTTKFRF